MIFMCGRYFFRLEENTAFLKLRKKIDQLALFEYAKEEIYPSNKALVLLPDDSDVYTLEVMRWGIKGNKGKLFINARSEHIEEKRTFIPMLQKRCLIPCNGFYEWVKHGERKNKVLICKTQSPLFYLAGIYNQNHEFVIVTGESQGDMKYIHHRTPIVINENQISHYFTKKQEFKVDNEGLSFLHQDKKSKYKQLDLFSFEEDEK